jgi:hypothetical protein
VCVVLHRDKQHAETDWNDPNKYTLITNTYIRYFLALKNTNTCLYLQLTTWTNMLREPKISQCEDNKSENCFCTMYKTMAR